MPEVVSVDFALVMDGFKSGMGTALVNLGYTIDQVEAITSAAVRGILLDPARRYELEEMARRRRAGELMADPIVVKASPVVSGGTDL